MPTKSDVGRIRRRVVPAGKKSISLGYFESATVNGLGQILKWDPQTRSPVYTSLADSPISAEFCEDENHHKQRGRYDSGGNFLLLRYQNNYNPSGLFGRGTYTNLTTNPSINGGQPFVNRRYVGGFSPPPNSFFQIGADFSSAGPLLQRTNSMIPTMAGLGERAWNGTKPDFQQLEGFTSAAEADEAGGMVKTSLETVKRLRTEAKRFNNEYITLGGTPHGPRIGPRAVANEFLNIKFGWIPFVQDVIDFTKTVHFYRNLLVKALKYNGIPIRKRISLFSDSKPWVKLAGATYSVSNNSYPMPCHAVAFPSDFFSSAPSWEVVEGRTSAAYGIGKWTIYRPEFDSHRPEFYSSWNKFEQFLTLTGLRISPSSLYKATPWTWLIDWFTDIGNFFQFLTDEFSNSIVSRYCYAMQAQTITRLFTNVLPFRGNPVSLNFARQIVSKQRIAGSSPYGFDLPWESLTAGQYAILGALGITKR